MNIYPRGYPVRIKNNKIVKLALKNFASCYLHSHSVFCTCLILAKKYLRTFDVICVDYLRCAKKEFVCTAHCAATRSRKMAF